MWRPARTSRHQQPAPKTVAPAETDAGTAGDITAQHIEAGGHVVVAGAHSKINISGRQRLLVGAVGLVLLVLLGFWRQQRGANAGLRARLDAAVKRDAPGSELLREFRQRVEAMGFSGQKQAAEERTQRVLTELARDRAMTADELRQKMLQAAEGAKERIGLASQLRRAPRFLMPS